MLLSLYHHGVISSPGFPGHNAPRAGYRPLLRETALSFRPLTAGEKASIYETRLRVIEARSGETLGQLSARTSNVWSLDITAVVNGLAASQPLKDGQRIKIAVAEPDSRIKGG